MRLRGRGAGGQGGSGVKAVGLEYSGVGGVERKDN
jgi:hypothetical protein